MPQNRQIVLASSSSSRRQQLARLNLEFLSVAPNIDESPLPAESAEQLVTRLSIAKAHKIAENHTSALIIAGDQTAMIDGGFLSKPGTVPEAVSQLTRLEGREVCFYSGLSVVDSETLRTEVLVSICEVKFRRLSQKQIRRYVELDQPLHSAGSFKAESAGIGLFEYMRADDPSAITGMPLIALTTLLRGHGFELFVD